MWQLFALGSLALEALERSIDKIAIVTETIDGFAATFWRNIVFTLFFVLAGVLGVAGSAHIFLPAWIWVVGALGIVDALCYTYLLNRVEITGIAVVAYMSPIALLLIDTAVIHEHFLSRQVLGIVLLVAGGMAFVFDPATRSVKKEFSWKVWTMLFLGILYSILGYYVFRYYSLKGEVTEWNFYFNTSLVVNLGLIALAFVLGKWRKIGAALRHGNYVSKVAVSKSFDAMSGIVWLHAISLSSVAQTGAMHAWYPLVLFVVISAFTLTGFRTKEKLTIRYARLKTLGVICVIAGTLLVT